MVRMTQLIGESGAKRVAGPSVRTEMLVDFVITTINKNSGECIFGCQILKFSSSPASTTSSEAMPSKIGIF